MPIVEIRLRGFYASSTDDCVPSVSGKFDTLAMDVMDWPMLIQRMIDRIPSEIPPLTNVRDMTISEVKEFLENEAQSVSVHNPRAKESIT